MGSDVSSQAPSEVELHASRVWSVDVFMERYDGGVRAEARLHANDRADLVGWGESGLCPGQDLTLGEELAASRALERLAVALLAEAHGRVDDTDQAAADGSERRTRLLRSVPRILVGTDRPLHLTASLEWSLAHADPDGLGIELCHVVDDSGPAWEQTLRSSVSDAKDEMTELLDEVRELHPALNVTSSVLVGSESALLARSQSRELVVIGRADMEGQDGSYVGATAITIAQGAKVPVVVVPPRWSPRQDGLGPVMVAIDALEPHLEAVEFALAYAHWRGLPLLAVSAWDRPADLGAQMMLDSEEEWMERIADGLDAAVTPLRLLYPDVPVTKRSPHGPPVDVILGLAESASLLVMGRPGHGRHWRMPLGSVSRRLLHRATVPIAVVPTGWHAEASALPRRELG